MKKNVNGKKTIEDQENTLPRRSPVTEEKNPKPNWVKKTPSLTRESDPS